LTSEKLHSPYPWFVLVALLALAPVLNNMYPVSFFPALPSFVVELVCVFAGSGAAAMGFLRVWNRLQSRSRTRALVRQAAEWRNASDPQEESEVANAGRSISRLARNADEDLREIGPDFSMASLARLPQLLPVLMEEVGNEADARIRLGVVGTYLGETLCRNQGYQWHFRADPSLRQFSYLCSIVKKEGRGLDPYAWASDLLTGRKKISDFMKETT